MIQIRRRKFLLWNFILAHLSFVGICSAQESIIDTVQKIQPALVTVQAVQSQTPSVPQAQAALDTRTKKVLIARKLVQASSVQQAAGVVIRPDGIIVTNIHTILHAQHIYVKLHNQNTYPAQILHLMPQQDLALLKISPPQPLLPIEFSNSNAVRLGDDVIHIGRSELLKDTISGGKITGLATSSLEGHRHLKSIELIRVNIDIYKGDSGGPLLDRQGRLIGMMFAKIQTRPKESLAIPSNKIKALYMEYAQ